MQPTFVWAGRGQAPRTRHSSNGSASCAPARGGRRPWPATQGPRVRCACRGGSEDAAGAAARWAANSGARLSQVVTAASSGSVRRYVTCTFFKAAQKLKSDATMAQPVALHGKGYLRLANHSKTSRHFLTRSLYKLCRTWLRRPIFKLMRIDVTPNGFASNSNSDLLDVLASYPHPRPHHCRLRSTYYKLY